jgi:hypothetical protein
MSFVDIALIAAIIAGAVYLLYRSIWKKKGHCPGCDSGISQLKISGGSEDGSKKHCDRQE